MTFTTSRRDVVKLATGLVIGAGLAGGTAPVEVAAAVPRRDMAAIFTWERALQAADDEGARWVRQVHILRAFLTAATDQAEQAGLPSVAASLHPLLAELDEIHQARGELFADWAFAAWAMPDLGMIPPRPWA